MAAGVRKFSRCGGTALPLGWQSSPAAVAMQCQTSSKVLPRQRENFATEVRELCFSDECTKTFEEKRDVLSGFISCSAVAAFPRHSDDPGCGSPLP